MTNLIIRAEKTADYKNTELMTMRSFWNKYFPGCADGFDESIAGKPVAGSDVLFIWNHKGGESEIARVVKNLLDDE